MKETTFKLAECISKVTLTRNTSKEMVDSLSNHRNLSPTNLIIQK